MRSFFAGWKTNKQIVRCSSASSLDRTAVLYLQFVCTSGIRSKGQTSLGKKRPLASKQFSSKHSSKRSCASMEDGEGEVGRQLSFLAHLAADWTKMLCTSCDRKQDFAFLSIGRKYFLPSPKHPAIVRRRTR